MLGHSECIRICFQFGKRHGPKPIRLTVGQYGHRPRATVKKPTSRLTEYGSRATPYSRAAKRSNPIVTILQYMPLARTLIVPEFYVTI